MVMSVFHAYFYFYSFFLDNIHFSMSRAKLGNKSSYDIFAFQYGKKILKSLGIQKISPDEITLTPKLLGK